MRRKRKAALLQTTEDFAGRTTVHGIAYAFDPELGAWDRLLWLVVVVAFLGLAAFLTHRTWTDWREEQVITTLRNTALPVTEIPFPTVTICGNGFHMNNVERAVGQNFAKWRKENNRTGLDTVTVDMADYMKSTF